MSNDVEEAPVISLAPPPFSPAYGAYRSSAPAPERVAPPAATRKCPSKVTALGSVIVPENVTVALVTLVFATVRVAPARASDPPVKSTVPAPDSVPEKLLVPKKFAASLLPTLSAPPVWVQSPP